MAKFRKKPIVIEAMQFCGDNFTDIGVFLGSAKPGQYPPRSNTVVSIATLEGTMFAQIGDWIIRGVKGEFYPCKPDIFEATYERVEE